MDEGSGLPGQIGQGFGSGLSPFLRANPLPYGPFLLDQSQAQTSGVVDEEAARSLSDDQIIQQVISSREESRKYRRPLEPDWRLWEALYRNQLLVDEQKQDWQAQISFALLFNKVETAVSLFKAALLDSPEWFRCKKRVPDGDEIQIRLIQRVIEILAEVTEANAEFMKALRESLICGTSYLSFSWDRWISNHPRMVQIPLYQDPQQMQMAAMMGQPITVPRVIAANEPRGGVVVRWRSLWGMFPDPFSDDLQKGKYLVEESNVDRDDILQAMQAGQYWNVDIDEFGGPVQGTVEGDERWRLTQTESSGGSIRPRDLVTRFWGDIRDDRGRVVLRNWYVTLLNERHIIGMGANPFWHGFRPYIEVKPIPYQGRAWGRSISEAAAPLQQGYNDLVNLGIDNLRLSIMQMYTEDSTARTQNVTPTVVSPGAVVSGRGKDILRPITFPTAVNQIFPMLNLFRSGIDDAMRISEFQEGTPTSRGRPTKYEVMMKSGRGDALITNMARDIEDDGIAPMLRMIFRMYWQFGDERSDPRLDALTKAFAGPQQMIDPLSRYAMLDQDFEILVRGVSGALQQGDTIDNMMQLLQLPYPWQPDNYIHMVYNIIQALGMDPERDIGLKASPQEMIAWQQQIAMQQQQQMAAGQSPAQGGPSRNGAAANGQRAPGGSPPPGRPEQQAMQMPSPQMGGGMMQ